MTIPQSITNPVRKAYEWCVAYRKRLSAAVDKWSVATKNKVARGFVISLMIATIFGDMLTTQFTTCCYPYNRNFLLWATGIISIIAVILFLNIRLIECGKNSNKVPQNEKLAQLIQNSCHGRFTDIIYIFAFLIYIDLLPNVIIQCINGDASCFRVLPYILGMIGLVYGKPTINSPIEEDKDERKVLITGISQFNIREHNSKDSNGESTYTSNCVPVFKPFEVFPNIEKVVILMTKDKFIRDEFAQSMNQHFKLEEDPSDARTSLDQYPIERNILVLAKSQRLSIDVLYKCNQIIKENSAEASNKQSTEINTKIKDALQSFMLDCIRQTNPEYVASHKEIELMTPKDVKSNSFTDCDNESVNIIRRILFTYEQNINIPEISREISREISSRKQEALKAFMLGCIRQTNPEYENSNKEIEFIFSNEVSYNSFMECNNESVRIIKHILSACKLSNNRKIEDKNIILNMTPGTAIVSSVMSLNSIKGERMMVYVDQEDGNLHINETPNASLAQLGDILAER
jgi:hypothetical protein